MRITNEKQFRSGRTLVERFRHQLEAESAQQAADGIHPRIREAALEAVRSEIRALENALSEYERIKAGASAFEVGSLVEIPTVLIKGRIARGWTQAELAQRLELKEQQIQRYESTQYAGVSFDRIREVAAILGVNVRGQAILTADAEEQDVSPWRPAAIAMLLGAVKKSTGQPLHGRTRLQKLLTVWGNALAEELGTPVFSPEPVHFGGFDQEVNDDVEFLAAGDLVSVSSSGDSAGPHERATPLQRALRTLRTNEPDERYELTREGLEWLQRFLASTELADPDKKWRLEKLVEAVANEYGHLPLDRLVEEVYAEFPEFTVNSRIKDRVMTRIRRRAGL